MKKENLKKEKAAEKMRKIEQQIKESQDARESKSSKALSSKTKEDQLRVRNRNLED